MFATIVCAKLGHGEDCETLQMLREWRDTELTKATYGDILLGQYYDLADLLLPELEEETDMEYFQHLHDAYVQPMVDAIRSKNNPEVISLSRQLVQDVEAKLDAFNNPMINFH